MGQINQGQDPLRDQRIAEQTAGFVIQHIGFEEGVPRPVFRKPYPDWADNNQYLRASKIPDFTVFTGEDEHSTVEHIS